MMLVIYLEKQMQKTGECTFYLVKGIFKCLLYSSFSFSVDFKFSKEKYKEESLSIM